MHLNFLEKIAKLAPHSEQSAQLMGFIKETKKQIQQEKAVTKSKSKSNRAKSESESSAILPFVLFCFILFCFVLFCFLKSHFELSITIYKFTDIRFCRLLC
jgi:hypothetical protein